MTNKLILQKMEFYGHHGVTAAERKLGRQIEVDLELVTDFTKAMQTDSLTETVDYSQVYQLVKQVVTGESFNLIEKIAATIAERVLRNYRQIRQVTVRVRKLRPPLDGFVAAVEFQLTKERLEPLAK